MRETAHSLARARIVIYRPGSNIPGSFYAPTTGFPRTPLLVITGKLLKPLRLSPSSDPCHPIRQVDGVATLLQPI